MKDKITLKMARVGANMTQVDMADALGIHPTTYLKWEKDPGDISIRDAVRICGIVKRDLDEISFVGDMN